MNQFETAKNIDAYCELAKAIVLLACDDYRCYNKHFCKNLDIMQYINGRMEEIKQAGEENPDEWDKLQRVKDGIEFDQRKLQSKITEIEMFLKSNYGMTLSYGLGNTILNKIKKEYPAYEPSAQRGKTLFEKREKQMQKRIKKLLNREK